MTATIARTTIAPTSQRTLIVDMYLVYPLADSENGLRGGRDLARRELGLELPLAHSERYAMR